MPKFIVNTNISKDKVPESFAGELTQQLSKALGKPAQVRPFAEMFSFFNQLCLCNELIGKIGERENKGYSKLLCELMSKQLKIPSDRIVIRFYPVEAWQIGKNRTVMTFL
uniref:Macrophage migration inhibitory factor n=1 Tax=Zonotrichia albicollis TaxID=44394 RepID=A0A8D2MQQ5_ZONAL